MTHPPHCTAVIPAKIGSRRIPRKNIKPLGGRPLIEWTLDAATRAETVDEVVVSTDGDEVREIAARWPVDDIVAHPEVTPDLEAAGVVIDALDQTGQTDGSVLMLLCTAPFRSSKQIDEAVRLHLDTPGRPNVLSVTTGRLVQHKTWVRDGLGRIRPPDGPVVRENGSILVATVERLRADGWFDGDGAVPYPMDRVSGYDIDWPEDWHRAERIAGERHARHLVAPSPMRVSVDMDGTLCHLPVPGRYDLAEPDVATIQRVRAWKEAGHRVIIDTARGSETGADWRDLTERQLEAWGVPYDELYVGEKRVADVYVDDRALNPKDWIPEG